MFAKCVAEFLGTMLFLTIIAKSGGDKYVVVAGLLAAILFMGNVSGDFNPAVTFMTFMKNGMQNQEEALSCVAAQLLGAAAAWKVSGFNAASF